VLFVARLLLSQSKVAKKVESAIRDARAKFLRPELDFCPRPRRRYSTYLVSYALDYCDDNPNNS
jgi:hypothetical protein